jgi:hypothetical protein
VHGPWTAHSPISGCGSTGRCHGSPRRGVATTGHALGSLVPYEPEAETGEDSCGTQGATPEPNQIALADLWPTLLSFIQKTD